MWRIAHVDVLAWGLGDNIRLPPRPQGGFVGKVSVDIHFAARTKGSHPASRGETLSYTKADVSAGCQQELFEATVD